MDIRVVSGSRSGIGAKVFSNSGSEIIDCTAASNSVSEVGTGSIDGAGSDWIR